MSEVNLSKLIPLLVLFWVEGEWTPAAETKGWAVGAANTRSSFSGLPGYPVSSSDSSGSSLPECRVMAAFFLSLSLAAQYHIPHPLSILALLSSLLGHVLARLLTTGG